MLCELVGEPLVNNIIIIGIIGVVYDVFGLRIYLPIQCDRAMPGHGLVLIARMWCYVALLGCFLVRLLFVRSCACAFARIRRPHKTARAHTLAQGRIVGWLFWHCSPYIYLSLSPSMTMLLVLMLSHSNACVQAC